MAGAPDEEEEERERRESIFGPIVPEAPTPDNLPTPADTPPRGSSRIAGEQRSSVFGPLSDPPPEVLAFPREAIEEARAYYEASKKPVGPGAPPTPEQETLRMIAESDDPAGTLSRVNAANFVANMLQIDPGYAYDNLESLSEELYGRKLGPEPFLRALFQARRVGVQQYDLGILAAKWMDSGGTDEEMRQKLLEMSEAIEPPEMLPNRWLRNTLLTVANSMPQMARSAIAGGTWGMLAGIGVSLLYTAAALGTPLTGGMSLPAATALAVGVGTASGMTRELIETMRGQAYWRMRQNQIPHNVANTLGNIEGIVTGAVESLGNILLGVKIPGLTTALKSAGQIITRRLVAAGVVGNVATRIAAGAIGGAVSEGLIEEPIQELATILADAIADHVTKNDTIDPILFPEIVNRLSGAIAGGMSAGLIFGLGGSAMPAIQSIGELKRVRELAAFSNSREGFVDNAIDAGLLTEGVPADTAQWRGYLGKIWDQQHFDTVAASEARAARVEAAGPQPTAPGLQEGVTEEGINRQEGGRLYTENRVRATTGETTSRILLSGDQTTGERYAYITFDVEPDLLRVDEVVSEGPSDLRQELLLELMEQYPGIPIKWDPIEDVDTPAEQSNIELKQRMIAANPRGEDFGLQYLESTASQETTEETSQETTEEPPVPEELVRELSLEDQARLSRELADETARREGRPPPAPLDLERFVLEVSDAFNMNDEQGRILSDVLERVAGTQGITGTALVRRIMQDRVIDRSSTGRIALRNEKGAVASTTFQIAKTGETVDFAKAMTADEAVKALFSALENANFHDAMHEIFHAIERLFLSPEQIALFEQAIGKSRAEWTVSDIEGLANGWLTYLGSGTAPIPELQSLYEKMADILWEIVSYVKEMLGFWGEEAGPQNRPRMSAEFEAAYDALLTTQQREAGLVSRGQGFATEEAVVQAVQEEIVEPSTEPAPAPGISALDPVENPVVWVEVKQLHLSDEVPNFKEGANKKGVIDELEGTSYLTTPPYPIMVWERLDGRLEVITGRHRMDLAKRLKTERILAQVLREQDGFTAAMAMTMDAEANIREEKGTVRDYGNYFRNTVITEAEASSRGLLDSDKGRTGFAIGRYASDGLYSAYTNGRISAQKAAAIATAGRYNDGIQDLGIKRAGELSAEELVNFLNIIKEETREIDQVEQVDLFGRNESFMVNAAAVAREAVKKQKELRQQLTTLKQVLNMSSIEARRDAVEAFGIDMSELNKPAIQKKIRELENEIDNWRQWTQDPEKMAQLQDRAGVADQPVLFHTRIEPTEMVSPASIIPRHEVREMGKRDLLVGAMKAKGWIGRPVLVVDIGNELQGITGTHRLAAASAAGISAPVYVLDVGDPATGEIIETSDDDELLSVLERLRDEGVVPDDAVLLMREEIALADEELKGLASETVDEATIAYGSEEAVDQVAEEVDQLMLNFTQPPVGTEGGAPWVSAGNAIAGTWQTSRRVDMRGHVARNPEQLAQLFSVYRHPRLEHFHFILTDDSGKIVAHNAISSGLPGRVKIAGNQAKMPWDLVDRMERAGATRFYVLHNHPSGNAEMSPEDMSITSAFARVFPLRFAGHVVIGRNTYTYASPVGDVDTGQMKPDTALDQTQLGPTVSDPQTFASAFLKATAEPDATAAIVLNARNQVISVVPVNGETVNPQQVYQIVRERGGSYAGIVTGKPEGSDKGRYHDAIAERFRNAPPLLRVAYDVVSVDEQGGYTSTTESDREPGGAPKWFPSPSWQTAKLQAKKVKFLYHTRLEQPAVLAKKAIKIFGLTTDPSEAGYILPDGKMLDFSGKQFAAPEDAIYRVGTRTLDHREIYLRGKKLLGLTSTNPTAGMYEWMVKTGAVRLKGLGNAEMTARPTPAQMRQLIKALRANESGFEANIVVTNDRGNSERAWSGMSPTVAALNAFFAEVEERGGKKRGLYHTRPNPWILKSVETLRAKMRGPMRGPQILAMLTKAGIKADEMQWLNLEEYLAIDEKRTINEVLEHIEENEVDVIDTVLGADTAAIRRFQTSGLTGEQAGAGERIEEIERRIRATQIAMIGVDEEAIAEAQLIKDGLAGDFIRDLAARHGVDDPTYEEVDQIALTATHQNPDTAEVTRTVLRREGESLLSELNHAELMRDEALQRGYADPTEEPRWGSGDYNLPGGIAGSYGEILLKLPWSKAETVKRPMRIKPGRAGEFAENNRALREHRLYMIAADRVLLDDIARHDGRVRGSAINTVADWYMPGPRVVGERMLTKEEVDIVTTAAKQFAKMPGDTLDDIRHGQTIQRDSLEDIDEFLEPDPAFEPPRPPAHTIEEPFENDVHFSGHENFFAHARYALHDALMNERVLLIEEIQSDWHQKARDIRKTRIKVLAKERGVTRKEASKLVPPDFGYGRPPAPAFEESRVHVHEWEQSAEPLGAGRVITGTQIVTYTNNDQRYSDAVTIQRIKDERTTQPVFRVVGRTGRLLQEAEMSETIVVLAIAELERRYADAHLARESVPDAPFKKTWHELTFRRLLRMAAEAGVDRMAWTTGEQQADRWDMRKLVDEIRYKPRATGTYDLSVWKEGAQLLERVGQTREDLEDFLGQEMAEKIFSGEGELADDAEARAYRDNVSRGQVTEIFQDEAPVEGTTYQPWHLRFADGSTYGSFPTREDAARDAEVIKKFMDAPRRRVLKGLDLDVGGEGHKFFYDGLLVNYARKYGKKWGARVEDVEIETGGEGEVTLKPLQIEASPYGGWFVRMVDPEDGSTAVGKSFSTREAAEAEWDEMVAAFEHPLVAPERVHSILITPEMKASVEQGQYLFHTRKDWQSEFLYGTPVSGEVYQSYVDEAKIYDTLAEFTDAMQTKYGDLYLGDMDEATAGEFYDAVFREAQLQKRPAEGPGVEIEEPKDLPEVSEYDPQVKHDVAAKMEDDDLAERIAEGKLTQDEIMELVQQISEEEADARAAGADLEAEAKVGHGALSTGEQQLLELGDQAQSALERLEAMPPDSPRREMAEARARALLDQLHKALLNDLDTAADLVDEAVWNRAILIEETVNDPDLLGRLGRAGEDAARLGRELQRAIDEKKAEIEAARRTRLGRESRARIYAKKRADIKRHRKEVHEIHDRREAGKELTKARIKLMKSIMRPPGRGVEFRGYAETIRQIQEGLDPLSPEKRSLYQKLHSRKFLADNPDVAIYMTEEWLDNIYAQTSPDMATLEQINELVQRLRQDGRHKRSMEVEAEKNFREATRARLVSAVLRGKTPQRPVGTAKKSPWWLDPFGGWKPSRMALLLDGNKENGPWDQWLQDEVNAAWAAYRKALRAREKKVFGAMKKLGLTMDPLALDRKLSWLGRHLELNGFRQDNGRPLTAQHAMYFYIGMKNERTHDALIFGNLLPENVILKAIAELTPNERAFADVIARDFEENFPRLREAFITTFNMDLPGEDHYVPHRRLDISYENRQDEVASDLVGRAGLGKQWVSRRPTYSRLDIDEEHQKPIRTDLVGLWQENVKITEGFIHQDQLIKRMHSMIESDEVRQAVQQRYGSKMNKWLSKYINDLAQEDAYQGQSGIEKASRILRTNAATSYLSFNLAPMLVQLTGPLNALADAGPLYLAGAAAQYLGGQVAGKGLTGNTLVDFVDERTEILRSRQINQELEDLKRLNYKLYQNVIKKIGTVGMYGFTMIDKMTVYIGWKAVYDKNVKKIGETAAIRAADKSIVRSQPSSRVQDMAQVYRQGEILKWFTMFTGELNVIWNRWTFDIPMALRRGKILYAATDLAAIALVAVGVAVARGALYKDEPEERRAKIVTQVATELVESSPIIGRDIGQALSGRYMNSGVTIMPGLKNIIAAIASGAEGEWAEAARKAAKGLAISSGLPTTMPSKIRRAVEQEELAELLGWRK